MPAPVFKKAECEAMMKALRKVSSVVDSIWEVAERASVVEEFGPELVTNEVPYSDPVFLSSVVAESCIRWSGLDDRAAVSVTSRPILL